MKGQKFLTICLNGIRNRWENSDKMSDYSFNVTKEELESAFSDSDSFDKFIDALIDRIIESVNKQLEEKYNNDNR